MSRKENVKIELRNLRKASGYTLEEVANTLGIHVSTLLCWERGDSEPRISEAMLLAELYEVDVNDIAFVRNGEQDKIIRHKIRKMQKMDKVYKNFINKNK